MAKKEITLKLLLWGLANLHFEGVLVKKRSLHWTPFCLKPPSVSHENRAQVLRIANRLRFDRLSRLDGAEMFFFRQAKGLQGIYGYLWKILFLTKFIEILHVPKMSLQRDFDWEASKLRGWGALIARELDGCSHFCKFTLAFSTIFWGFRGSWKTFNAAKLWPTQIRRRWKYQSTVKYLSASLSFQFPKATFFERPGFAPTQLCDILSG